MALKLPVMLICSGTSEEGLKNKIVYQKTFCRLKETDARHRMHLENQNIEEILPGFWRTKFSRIQSEVERSAGARGVQVLGDSVIIGFTPEISRTLTMDALEKCKSSLVASLTSTQM